MSEPVILEFFARGSRNTADQVRDFARWVASGGAVRREQMLAVLRALRRPVESPFSSDTQQPTP